MSHRLPSLSIRCLLVGMLLGLAGAAAPLAAQTSSTSPVPSSPVPSSPVPTSASGRQAPDSTSDPDGNRVLAEAVQQLLRQPALEAKVRQRATILGQLMAGAGLYVQAQGGDQLLIRYEFKLQVRERSVAILHINDGSTLWIRRDVADESTQAYVNLRRLREARNARPQADRSPTDAANALGGDLPLLALGGLPQLLQSLAERFDFPTARGTEIAGLPVWELTGEWKPRRLAVLLPQQQERLAQGLPPQWNELPAHLPNRVKLTLGRDRNFPLFPYRLEYLRVQQAEAAQAGRPAVAEIVRPLVTLELYEVQRRENLPAELFQFAVGDQEVEDQTDRYLAKLGLLPSSNE